MGKRGPLVQVSLIKTSDDARTQELLAALAEIRNGGKPYEIEPGEHFMVTELGVDDPLAVVAGYLDRVGDDWPDHFRLSYP